MDFRPRQGTLPALCMCEWSTVLSEYLSSDERQDVHLASVSVLDGGHDEAGAAQGDLTLGPAVHGQRQLPFPDVEHAGELHAL